MLDVLVVDDDEHVRSSVAGAIAEAGHRVAEARNGDEALSLLTSRAFDLAVCDVQMPGIDGLTLLRRLRYDSPGTAVVLMTSFGKVPDAVDSLRAGAVDYVTKPFDPDEFALKVVGPIAQRRAHLKTFEEARAAFVSRKAGGALVGTSLVMRQLADRVGILAQGDASVFIEGGPGTGKKLAARTIHARSPRRDGPLLFVACASLTDGMLDGEPSRNEWFRAAERGTMVLYGLDELPLEAQRRLLQIVDEPSTRARRDGDWRPLGVRLISLSETSPSELVTGGRFIEPLLFRLNAAHLRVPALVEREGDLDILACHFLTASTPPGREPPNLSPGAWEALSAYRFPGNVGELAWAIEHAVARSDGKEIARHDLPERIGGAPLGQGGTFR